MAWRSKRCLLIVSLWCWCASPSANVAPSPVSHRRPQPAAGARCWQVSNYGRCRSLSGVVTNGTRCSSRYLRVGIGGKKWNIHRLVLFAFRPCPIGGRLEGNHLDGNRSNNCVDNLEWATPKQNVRHSFQRLARRSAGPKLSMAVRCRPVGSNNWKAYGSMKEAANALGISKPSVSRSCRHCKEVKGYECRLAAGHASAVEGEEWKQVIDPKTSCPIPGKMVSDLGRVKSKTGRISSGHTRKDGYCKTRIRVGATTRYRLVYIHQLVARSFLGLPPSPQHTQVNHKDGNPSNNSACNLEYVTPAQNVAHSYRIAPRRTYSHVKPLESREYGSSGAWRRRTSIRSAERDLGLHCGSICSCLKGRRKHAGGYEYRSLPSSPDLPGEEWRNIDLKALEKDRALRTSRNEGHT